MTLLHKVRFTRFAEKQINKLPEHIIEALEIWIKAIEYAGIFAVRRSSGYHDEPLHGLRKGQRSVRLNRAYRVIYIEEQDGTILFIKVLEVNNHDY